MRFFLAKVPRPILLVAENFKQADKIYRDFVNDKIVEPMIKEIDPDYAYELLVLSNLGEDEENKVRMSDIKKEMQTHKRSIIYLG